MSRELRIAVTDGNLPKVQRLLRGDVGSVTEEDESGYSVLFMAFSHEQFQTAQWLLEYGGADISLVVNGDSVWNFIPLPPHRDDEAAALELLRGMLLRGDPPADFTSPPDEYGSPEWVHLVQEGMRLRTRLPAYLVQRQSLLNEHCLLIPPLRAIVSSYAEPAVEELWATRLGAAP
jgi:hypothetical protein